MSTVIQKTPSRFSLLRTIGHSTRPIGDFIGLLLTHGIQLLADIRTIPFSRRNPQFHQEAFAQSLRGAGLQYRHMPALGGRRKSRPDSVNLGWRNQGFRGYADYHANRRVLGCAGRPRGDWSLFTSGHHVRRGRSLALSSVPDFGCGGHPWMDGAAHNLGRPLQDSHSHTFRQA
jgi:hypothetical protein